MPCEPHELYIDVESAESCKLGQYNGKGTELQVRGEGLSYSFSPSLGIALKQATSSFSGSSALRHVFDKYMYGPTFLSCKIVIEHMSNLNTWRLLNRGSPYLISSGLLFSIEDE